MHVCVCVCVCVCVSGFVCVYVLYVYLYMHICTFTYEYNVSYILTNRKQRVVLNVQSSSWTNVKAGVSQGFILGPLLFLIHINDLTDRLSNTKLFSDDTSLFSVIHDSVITTLELNSDLQWAFQQKMSFNPDPNKQAQEVIFSKKLKIICHPTIHFSNNNVSQASSQNHLGLTLDNRLTFDKHLTSVSNKISKTT